MSKQYNPYNWIAECEGFRSKPYKDTEGVITIGHGLTYLTEDESMEIMTNRVVNIMTRLQAEIPDVFDHHSFNVVRKTVIASMVFQLGWRGTMNFKKMWAELKIRQYLYAANEMLDSRWAMQTPLRAEAQAKMMSTGNWVNEQFEPDGGKGYDV